MTVNTEQKQLFKTARITGLWYLMIAISGILGFMVFHYYIYYAKGTINMYQLQETSGARKVNTALKCFLEDWNTLNGKVKLATNRYPTSQDLLGYFSEVTPDHQQHIITDLFETVGELKIDKANE